jgi:hypothetical protein
MIVDSAITPLPTRGLLPDPVDSEIRISHAGWKGELKRGAGPDI